MTGEQRLSPTQWRSRADAHRERALVRLTPVIERRRLGHKHPVEDFMFDYYRLRPADVLQWSPGAGVVLDQAADVFQGRRFHLSDDQGSVRVDTDLLLAKRAKTLTWTRELLAQVHDRTPQFGCFGLHEWAMVHRLSTAEVRHTQLPLRYSVERTAEIVEAHDLKCSHYDAFRFFTPPASVRNAAQLTRADQLTSDQPGCLHVNMDLYKWAGKLHPLIGTDLLWQTFELAWQIRELDMRASAYDLSAWGLSPVPIETAAGKAEYVRQQRLFADRAQVQRRHLLDAIEAL